MLDTTALSAERRPLRERLLVSGSARLATRPSLVVLIPSLHQYFMLDYIAEDMIDGGDPELAAAGQRLQTVLQHAKAGAKDIRNCHINIGTGKEITIRELAGLIVNTVGYQGKLTFDSSKPDGTMRKLTDPSKLHNLGWHHKIDIEEGVQRMYEWYLG